MGDNERVQIPKKLRGNNGEKLLSAWARMGGGKGGKEVNLAANS